MTTSPARRTTSTWRRRRRLAAAPSPSTEPRPTNWASAEPGLLRDDRQRFLRFRGLDDVERGGLADPVLDVARRRRAGEADRLEQLLVQVSRVLGAQVRHRADAEAPHQRDPALHPGHLEQRALVDELEEAIAGDA